MAADRGRLSYYAARKYREVVTQQGRVMLEADANEAQRVLTEETRLEAFDFVGPCGTPDDGYKVSPGGSEFTVGRGTMYVGGLRVTLAADTPYSKQSDWLDRSQVAPWDERLNIDSGALAKQAPMFAATLVLREQEITAVEDPALREVALGGPDTAARTRLIQRVVAIPAKGATCAAAMKNALAFWSDRGLLFEAESGLLASRARLQVTPVAGVASTTVCDPPADSGYLGADNQMIRVQVAALDTKTNSGSLLWGYFNASTLYRATVKSATTIELETRPIAPEYEPGSGRVVQVLAKAASLGEGAFAAALVGHFAKLSTPYARETKIVTLPAPLSTQIYPVGSVVYARLWEDHLQFSVGTAVGLQGAGLQVTVTAGSAGPLHVGDYWCIAVRPSMPTQVYPERLITAPQPPDGPRMWACPLAVLARSDAKGLPPTEKEKKPTALKLLDDCRKPFDNLVELTARKSEGCVCTVCVTPETHSSGKLTLQAAVELVKQAKFGGVICLEAGHYELREALTIATSMPLRIVGKGAATTIVAQLPAFKISDSKDLTLEGFCVSCKSVAKGSPPALQLSNCISVRLQELTISVVGKQSLAIALSGAFSSIVIRDNDILAAIGIVALGRHKALVGLKDLRIEGNHLDCSTVGIAMHATVHQGDSRISSNVITGCSDAALVFRGQAVPGGGLEVIGNEIEALGDGIQAGVSWLSIKDNRLSSQNGGGRGIVLASGLDGNPLEDVQIANNRISNFEIGMELEKVGLGIVAVTGNQVEGSTIAIRAVELNTMRGLSIDSNQLRAEKMAVYIDKVKNACIGVRANLFAVAAGVGAHISCSVGDCTFADNQSMHGKGQKEAVFLGASRVVFSSNRIEGGVALKVDERTLRSPNGPKTEPLCTVLGNITAGNIVVNTRPLSDPWAPLNVTI